MARQSLFFFYLALVLFFYTEKKSYCDLRTDLTFSSLYQFTSVSSSRYTKGLGSLSSFRNRMYGCEKWRKRSGFVLYSYFKYSAFTAVKKMQNSKLSMRKRYHFSTEVICILKGNLFCRRWYGKVCKGLGLGAEPPLMKLC